MQEEEYKEVEKMMKEQEENQKKEELLKVQKEEEEEKERERLRRLEEEERELKAKRLREMSPEPNESESEIVNILFRLPNGHKISHRFRFGSQIQVFLFFLHKKFSLFPANLRFY